MATDVTTPAPSPVCAPQAPWRRWVSGCACAALLVVVALDSRARGAAGDAAPHHARVAAIARDAMPFSIGEWVGTDDETPEGAAKLLNANAIVNRRYRNLATGETVSFLFVHCSEARDLIGHYPPVCYPSNGLTAAGAQPRDWQVAGRTVEGVRYRFENRSLASPVQTTVDNFMALPTGEIGRDMDAVDAVARDRRVRSYGVAEFQIVTTGPMSDARRDEILRTFVEQAFPLIDAVRAEVKRD